MKITVEDILDLYDPCRDHEILFCQDDDLTLTKYLGCQLQQTEYIKCEVDSIGVSEDCLVIYPTDRSLAKMKRKANEDSLLGMLEATKGNLNTQAIILETYIQTFGPLSNEAGEKARKILGENDGADDSGKSEA